MLRVQPGVRVHSQQTFHKVDEGVFDLAGLLVGVVKAELRSQRRDAGGVDVYAATSVASYVKIGVNGLELCGNVRGGEL